MTNFINILKKKEFLITFIVILLAILTNIIFISFSKQINFDLLYCIIMYSISSYLVYISTQSTRIVTIQYFFFFMYVIFVYIGSMLYYFKMLDLSIYSDFFKTDLNNYTMFWLTNLGLIFFGLGLNYANIYKKFKPKKEINIFLKSELVDNIPNIYLYILLGFSIIVACIYLFTGSSIPIIEMFKNPGNIMHLVSVRDEFTQKRSFISYMYAIYGVVFPFVSLLCLSKYYYYKNSRWKWISIITIILVFITLTASTQRWPILLYTMILTIFIYNNSYKKPKSIIVIPIIGVLISLLFTILKWKLAFIEGLYSLALRFLGQATPNIFVIKYFPSQLNFFWGETYLNDLLCLLPGQQKATSVLIYHLIFGDNALIELGTSPIGIISEGYINFGILGALLIPFCLGFLIQIYQINIFRKKKNILDYSVFCYFTITLATWSDSRLMGVIIAYLLVIIIVVLIIKKRIFNEFIN